MGVVMGQGFSLLSTILDHPRRSITEDLLFVHKVFLACH